VRERGHQRERGCKCCNADRELTGQAMRCETQAEARPEPDSEVDQATRIGRNGVADQREQSAEQLVIERSVIAEDRVVKRVAANEELERVIEEALVVIWGELAEHRPIGRECAEHDQESIDHTRRQPPWTSQEARAPLGDRPAGRGVLAHPTAPTARELISLVRMLGRSRRAKPAASRPRRRHHEPSSWTSASEELPRRTAGP